MIPGQYVVYIERTFTSSVYGDIGVA